MHVLCFFRWFLIVGLTFPLAELAGAELALTPDSAARLALEQNMELQAARLLVAEAEAAGTRKGLAVYAVRDPQDVPGIAALGPDPLTPDFSLAPLVAGRRMQIKRLIRDQKVVAGIGNAYSDEILHAAKLSPFAIAADLTSAEIETLDAAVRDVLSEALTEAHGKAAAELKDDKRARMRVHGRVGEPCPVCGATVAEVVYVGSSLQYCPACQTGGKLLKDRTTSKFLK